MSKKEKDAAKKPQPDIENGKQAQEVANTADTAADAADNGDGGSETAGAAAKELEEAKDRLLRVTAEYSNYKRRSEKERQDAYSFAKADTVKELLPVIDDLERALANETEDYEALKKGVEMTFAKLGGVLEKLGIEVFGKPGETFDPNLHNAVMHIEDDKYAAGEIVDVYQKGYKIGDKIIRAAMVRTAN